MEALLDNFRDFIARAGFFAYLEQFVQIIYLEGQRGAAEWTSSFSIIRKKYIVETKIWGGNMRYEAGKAQLATYVKLEAAAAGYYVAFDHRKEPESR